MSALQRYPALLSMQPDAWVDVCTAADVAELEQEKSDADQQLELLRPGGLYAWKSKYEEASRENAALRQAQERVIAEWRGIVKDIRAKWPSPSLDLFTDGTANVMRNRAYDIEVCADTLESELAALASPSAPEEAK